MVRGGFTHGKVDVHDDRRDLGDAYFHPCSCCAVLKRNSRRLPNIRIIGVADMLQVVREVFSQ
jgi:hypothetical protein